METLKKIANNWNALKTDIERWKYILEHKDQIMVMLDNDDTIPVFCPGLIPGWIEDYDDLPSLNDFHQYLGNSEGVKDLLSVLGIKAEGV